ncbi:hypothetical protein [Limosilactobacillus vaginalis]|uniref:hypothetical protein n=1 Tax=Limosilactobacillus vaginalis TaxID=1633 RepID=UPI00265EF766|nr:hypothetical protein [Limosilactobacillus vaginalis]
MCELSDIEKVEAKYPQLRFWGIEVDNPHFHAKIVGHDVYINMLQPDVAKLKAMLHETVHYDFDYSNLSNNESTTTMHSEGWARREGLRRYDAMFGDNKK